MLEDVNEQKYPFLLVFLQVCGLKGTPKYISLADVRSAISLQVKLFGYALDNRNLPGRSVRIATLHCILLLFDSLALH